MTSTSTLVTILLLFSLAIRHDVDEAQYLELGADFPSVVQVGGLASGTVIAPEWVLTAAHAPEMLARMRPDAPLMVMIEDQAIEVEEVHYPSQREDDPHHHDIALLKLGAPVSETIQPIALSSETPRVEQEFVLAGWGILAVADKGVEVSPAAMAAPTRARRAGRNLLDRYDSETGLLHADLDAPEDGIELEAGPSIGDSGGPALVQNDGDWQILGVTALVDDGDGDRIIGEYGESFGMTSVLGYLDWIESTITK